MNKANGIDGTDDSIASRKPNEYVCMLYCCIETIRKSFDIV